MPRTRQAVVLAAGEGTRLASVIPDRPKPLVPIAGQPLLALILQRLEQSGFGRVFLITGYQFELIQAFLENFSSRLHIETVHNPAYRCENGSSLLCARNFVPDRFVLAMGDHLADSEIYDVAACANGLGLCVDKRPTLVCQVNDATRVWVENEKIVRIGKELSEWNAMDAGVFALTPEVFDALDWLGGQTQLTITEAIRTLIAHGQTVRALDVSGKFWADVDTPEDLREVEQLWKQPSLTPLLSARRKEKLDPP